MTDRVTRAIQQEGRGFRAVAYNVPNTEHGIVSQYGWTAEEAVNKREADIKRILEQRP